MKNTLKNINRHITSLSLLFVSVTALNAQTVTTYLDRATFLAEGNLVANEDFEGYDDTALSVFVNNSTAFDGMTITTAPAQSIANGYDHNILTNPSDPTLNGFGNITGQGSALGPALANSSQTFELSIDVPAIGMGYDYLSWSNSSHNSVHIFEFANGSSYSVNPKGDLNTVGDGLADFSGLGTSGFFGLVSDSPIVDYRVEFLASGSVEGWGMDNVSLINVVPEPSSTILLGMAGLGLISRRRR